MIQAVIFDMDGLLIDSEPYWQATERKVFGELGIELTEEMQRSTYGLRTDEQIRHWHQYQPWDEPDLRTVESRYDQIMIDFFREEGKLKEGALEALDFFTGIGHPMALASSSSMELINVFLEKFELQRYFTVVNSAEFEKLGKPHPGVYLETARRLRVHPVKCLALEDSFHGMIAAKAARMKTIVVPDERERDDPRFGASDVRLHSLSELNEEVYRQINTH